MSRLTIEQERKQRAAQSFFGTGCVPKSKGEVGFSAVIDNDTIYLITDRVRLVYTGPNESSYVFAVGPATAVYLKAWQVARVIVRDNATGSGRTQYVVKLNRKFFKAYHFSRDKIISPDENGKFKGITDEAVSFDTLFAAALEQGRASRRVEMVA